MTFLAANWKLILLGFYGLGHLGTHIFKDNTIAFQVSKWLVTGANGPGSVAAFFGQFFSKTEATPAPAAAPATPASPVKPV